MVEAAANELESSGEEDSSSRKIVKTLFRICKDFHGFRYTSRNVGR
jgi:hypothetical protein